MGDEAQDHGSQVIPLRGWKIRFDSPPGLALSRRTEGGDILSLFRAWDNAPRKDRRDNPRYAPATSQIWVGWWKRARFLVSPASLVNLSRGGALIDMANRPPTSQPVWICLGAPHPIDYAQCRVLDSSPESSGSFLARVEFHAPCPVNFFLAAGVRVDEPPS